uniref:Uncharacterized protein n=1 Tax=Hyaloperonospora arabidopsidis (strain Emoy2) TaxID=559515 RepID=M4BV19_HYAAE
MRALIDAAASDNGERNGKKKRTADMDESEDESDKNDSDEGRYQDELSVVANGEHVVLKNLTNESLPVFIEAVLLCAIASLHRAAPKKSSTQALADMNPFMDYCRAMNVFGSALGVFAQAEACGFNLPSKTNLLVLRGGAFATRSVRSILTKCIAWRIDQSVSDSTGALEHLGILFGAACAMSVAMEKVTHTFQERVVLKMQRNGRRGGWSSELLAKAYRRKYNSRRLISKTEAKLVPFFSHGIQELQDFLHDQSNVNNINLEAARAQWEAVEDVWGNIKHRDVMLSGDKLVRACRTLQTKELTSALLKDWRPAVPADTYDDETDDDDEGELAGTQEVDEESVSEEEDDGFVVRSDMTTSTNPRALLGDHKNLAVGLQDNGDLGFPTIVVNFKKQKKTHK